MPGPKLELFHVPAPSRDVPVPLAVLHPGGTGPWPLLLQLHGGGGGQSDLAGIQPIVITIKLIDAMLQADGGVKSAGKGCT